MITALIVAAGQGRRMGGNRRKQYLKLAGRPLLVHSVDAFASVACIDTIIVAVPADEIDFCRDQILPLAKSRQNISLIAGGSRRQDSVFNGLQALDHTDGMVLIHDGARPLVSHALIEACIHGARQWRACVPGILPVDTLKRIDARSRITETIRRESLRMVQTPQAFETELIKEAHRKARELGFQGTDDASLVEWLGIPVYIIPGEGTNLKITTYPDLVWAEAFLTRGSSDSNAV
jgi:2-C-methyl-D-erythritol 4-phosphate cytidylyltransferase